MDVGHLQALQIGFVRIARNKKALAGGIITLTVLILAVIAPVIAPYDYETMHVGERFQGPSRDHLMGTDRFGRDAFTRVVYGSRISLTAALTVAVMASLIGVPLGLICGYYGGLFDSLVMRLADVIFTFPAILMALMLGTIIGPGLQTVTISLSIVYSPQVARLVRGEVLGLREKEFVEASRASGAHPARLLLKHILPNCIAALMVQFSLIMAFSILAEAGITYLGYGTQPPTPSWGLMLGDGRDYMVLAPHISIFPGLAIMYTVLGFNFLGDGLRDIFDPRMKGAS